MGFNNPGITWSELEAKLSDSSSRHAEVLPGDGSDAPAWSRKKTPFTSSVSYRRGEVPYAELHCHSNFSFLDGASHPEQLVEEAARLGLEAVAITDHNGFYGVVRFADAAREVGIPTVFGAEVTIDCTQARTGSPDPLGQHLLVLAQGAEGYGHLSRALSEAQMNGSKGAPRISLEALAATVGGGRSVVLSGCRKGSVPAALYNQGPTAAIRELGILTDAFGRENTFIELWDHGHPDDSARNDALVRIAALGDVGVVATNNVHYATPSQRRLATALAAVRARSSLEDLDPWLPAGGTAHLRSGAEMARRFERYPGVVASTVELARRCAFDLSLVAPELPPYPCPVGSDGLPLDEMSFLRQLVEEGAAERYGARGSSRLADFVSQVGRDPYAQIEHELDLIETLGFPGYFLIVWDIVSFCSTANIYCQGRGSAANSAACYALGITNADAVGLGLLFERFLSPERDGPPDIDIDIESGRREEVIQYTYNRYGRQHAAQVANVITYRGKSALRDMAKALGYSTDQQNAWSKESSRWGGLPEVGKQQDEDMSVPNPVLELAKEVEHFPRHLGIHSGGMVICDRPVIEVCPTEWARMENRSVLQWDKEDCASAGLVKFDLLGLGMLTALHEAVDLIGEHHGVELDLSQIPQEDVVYDMLCEADTIGVFQIESRAQMATLPRLRPRTFYDLVVEIALIRPGPIQGGSVHPYIRRRNGKESVTYLHPLLKPSLEKTLGIPLFQEQLMQMAIDVAGFSPSEADELRQAMGSKRSMERMENLRQRLYLGMAERGIRGSIADQIYDKLAAFANYGFPESHSVSFAYLVYSSSWIKYHFPAAFCAALLRAQPMGFYSTHTLCQDATRHGVEVLGPDISASDWQTGLEPHEGSTGGVAVRLGFNEIRHVGDEMAEELADGRPYLDIEHVARSSGASTKVMESLATSGALRSLSSRSPDGSRRSDLWSAGAVGGMGSGRLPGIVVGTYAPQLPGMSEREEAISDLWSTGVAPHGHPTRFIREHLDHLGVICASELKTSEADRNVIVAGVVTHRQRPATAGGTLFINLEDETGLINIVCSLGCWTRFRSIARASPALMVSGRLERAEGVVNVVAHKLDALDVPAELSSRDFR